MYSESTPHKEELATLDASRFRQEAIVRALKSSSVCLCVTQRPGAKECSMRLIDKADSGVVSAWKHGAAGFQHGGLLGHIIATIWQNELEKCRLLNAHLYKVSLWDNSSGVRIFPNDPEE